MELEDDGLVFNPSLEVGGDRGFLALIGSLVTDIYNAAKLILRLAKGRMHYKVSVGLVTAPPLSLPPTTTRGQNRLTDVAALGRVCVFHGGGPMCDEEPRGVCSTRLPGGGGPDFSRQSGPVLGRPGFHSLSNSPPTARCRVCFPAPLPAVSLPPVIYSLIL